MRYIEDAVTLRFDSTLCSDCGMCLQVCPHGVFGRTGDGVVLADRGACMECGACVRNCQSGAVSVKPGVGCAAGILAGMLTGREPVCGGSRESSSCC